MKAFFLVTGEYARLSGAARCFWSEPFRNGSVECVIIVEPFFGITPDGKAEPVYRYQLIGDGSSFLIEGEGYIVSSEEFSQKIKYHNKAVREGWENQKIHWIDAQIVSDESWDKTLSVERAADFVIDTAVKKTTTGKYTVCFTGVAEKFNAPVEWVKRHKEEILKKIDDNANVLDVYIDEEAFDIDVSGKTACDFCDCKDYCAGCHVAHDKDPNIVEMEFSLKMDRIVTDKHYISPGGYAIRTCAGLYEFDFFESSWSIDQKDGSIIHVHVKGLDMVSSQKPITKKMFLSENFCWEEFFVYTGDKGEPEIHPEKLLELCIIFSDESLLTMNKLLKAANTALASD